MFRCNGNYAVSEAHSDEINTNANSVLTPSKSLPCCQATGSVDLFLGKHRLLLAGHPSQLSTEPIEIQTVAKPSVPFPPPPPPINDPPLPDTYVHVMNCPICNRLV